MTGIVWFQLAANAQFWRSFNIFKADFGHIKSSLQCTLFKQYCCSFYGAPIWQLRSNAVMNICTSWRKALGIYGELMVGPIVT